MKITVLNGTPVQGITYHFKEYFLEECGTGNEVTEFYPQDFPTFCLGCKNCFLKGEAFCPHIDKVGAIWESMLAADLIVVAYPIYALRVPGSLKTLYDHLCRHWFVHRPDQRMFFKKVVILTNSVGAALQQRNAVKDSKTNFSWMGVSKIYHTSAGMMGDILWNSISLKSDSMLRKKARHAFKKIKVHHPVRHMSIPTKFKFFMCKILHRAILKGEEVPSVDNQHYIDHGWIKEKRYKK